MILLVHFRCELGNSAWQSDDTYDWPLTCEEYDDLERIILEEHRSLSFVDIVGITPLLSERKETP